MCAAQQEFILSITELQHKFFNKNRNGSICYLLRQFLFPGHDIVATFDVERPVSLLEDNIKQLQTDIFEEFPIPSIKVSTLFHFH